MLEESNKTLGSTRLSNEIRSFEVDLVFNRLTLKMTPLLLSKENFSLLFLTQSSSFLLIFFPLTGR